MLVTVAHPDDETFGCGSLLARLTADGARVVVVCATRGEAGEDALERGLDPEALGAARTEELHAAAAILGVAEVELLAFADSGWDGPSPQGALVSAGAELVVALEGVLDRHRPDVVVTLDPTGSDGHRDHAAIGTATTAAVAAVGGVAAFYQWCIPRSLMQRWTDHVASSEPDSVYLETELGRVDDEITTIVSSPELAATVERAMAAHASQRSPITGLDDDLRLAFLTREHLVRVLPPWGGGPRETTLTGLS